MEFPRLVLAAKRNDPHTTIILKDLMNAKRVLHQHGITMDMCLFSGKLSPRLCNDMKRNGIAALPCIIYERKVMAVETPRVRQFIRALITHLNNQNDGDGEGEDEDKMRQDSIAKNMSRIRSQRDKIWKAAYGKAPPSYDPDNMTDDPDMQNMPNRHNLRNGHDNPDQQDPETRQNTQITADRANKGHYDDLFSFTDDAGGTGEWDTHKNIDDVMRQMLEMGS